MLLMGLDIGTSSVKAAVFDEDGVRVGFAATETQIDAPSPLCAQQDAEAVFHALAQVMRQAARAAGDGIGAISLSVQGDAIIPVDAQNMPVGPAHLGMDYRCTEEADAFAREFGGYELFVRTGMRPAAINSLCKIRHIVEREPGLASRAQAYRTYGDFALLHLGADESMIDWTMASRTMGMNEKTGQWDDELLSAAGIGSMMLSRIVSPGSVVGRLSAAMSDRTGVPQGALLVAGAHDQVCAALGAGLGKEGVALDSHGTAEVVSTVLSAPDFSRAMYENGFPIYRYADQSRYFTFSLNHAAGLLLRRYVEEFCEEDRIAAASDGCSAYDILLRRASQKASDLMMLPYVNGRGTPVNDTKLTGLIAGLTLSTTRADIARAILEALAFDLRINIDALRQANAPMNVLRCVGGGAKSSFGLQLKADVCGLAVETLEEREAACLGAAMLAGLGAGRFQNLTECGHLAKRATIYEPVASEHARYSERFAMFEAFYRANRELLSMMR